ncbi:MAG: DHA2 family efflux MFS transporter permease subunit [Acidimicrobiia bacterium]|nr:DHA2 family efflux MFS transporter permease subunit [Acidimicrobiia bacterium]
MAFLDATVVNIALPRIGTDLGIGLSGLQWTVNAYTLTLSGFLLLGGSLGDRYGRKRLFLIGVVWFAAASLLCAVSPSGVFLIGARAVQGIGAALLTPGSLAILEASFGPEDRAAAIGAWSGLGGVAAAVGPFLGGWLVDAATWRLVFLINLPLAVAVVWVASRHVPETRDTGMTPGLDVVGAFLGALGLAGMIYALTEAGNRGWTAPVVVATGLVGVLAVAAFVVTEARSPHPILPLGIFRSRQFTAANLVTFVVYGALGGALFLLPLQLQRGAGYSPLEAGTALAPLTVIMLLNSARAGRLAQRIGPRLPMTLGPLIAGTGLLLLTRIGTHTSYASDVLPGVVVFAVGLSFTVAPLTATVLAAASEEHAGVASAVNNEVARVAGLVAVAALPIAVGITSATYRNPLQLTDGFHTALVVAGLLCMAGGALSWLTIRNPVPAAPGPEDLGVATCPYHCAVDATPLAG